MRITERRTSARRLISSLLLLSATQPVTASGQVALHPENLRVMQGPLEAQHEEMLVNFLQGEANSLAGNRAARLKAIKTEDQFHTWQENNREAFLRLVGGLPEPSSQSQERTPLNARVVGQTWRQDYSVRQVIYESLPQFYVTADVYTPTPGEAARSKYPAVIVLCGRSAKGKHEEGCQSLATELAQHGY